MNPLAAVTLERLRDRVIDLDIAVDDARADLQAAIARLRDAVRARDEAARELRDRVEGAE